MCCAAGLLICKIFGSAHADTLPSLDQPFCLSRDDLHIYLLALARRDTERLLQMEKFAVLNLGLEVEVVVRGKIVGGMHVDKVRLTGPNASLIGWTLDFD